MQQTFQCYRCGAQNYVGQPACWNCQSPFQWNCPNCKAPVQNTMLSCPNCHALLPWQPQQQTGYGQQLQQRGAHSLHILSLDMQNKRLLGLADSGSSETSLVAVTSDGRITMLPIKDRADFYKLQKDVENSLKKKGNFDTICAAVVVALREIPTQQILIYKVTGGINYIPYVGKIWEIYDGLFHWTIDRISNRIDNCLKVEETFSAEPMRSMINALIGDLRRNLKWDEVVERALNNN